MSAAAATRNVFIDLFLCRNGTGPGIAEEIRDQIFEPFFSTKNTGLGLGLAVSKRIVDAHRGELVAGDREGGGAVFEVRLPLQCPAPVAEA